MPSAPRRATRPRSKARPAHRTIDQPGLVRAVRIHGPASRPTRPRKRAPATGSRRDGSHRGSGRAQAEAGRQHRRPTWDVGVRGADRGSQRTARDEDQADEDDDPGRPQRLLDPMELGHALEPAPIDRRPGDKHEDRTEDAVSRGNARRTGRLRARARTTTARQTTPRAITPRLKMSIACCTVGQSGPWTSARAAAVMAPTSQKAKNNVSHANAALARLVRSTSRSTALDGPVTLVASPAWPSWVLQTSYCRPGDTLADGRPETRSARGRRSAGRTP